MDEITVTIRNKTKETKKGRSNKKKQTSQSKHKPLNCGYCGGSGKDFSIGLCRVCGGEGIRPPHLRKKCPSCGGTGKTPGFGIKCNACGGWGYRK
ncbi:MAG: hypothetical protein WBC40_07140 [Halobacteriota archaeon]